MSDLSEELFMKLVWDAGDKTLMWARSLEDRGFIPGKDPEELLERISLDLFLRAYVLRRGIVFSDLSEERQQEERLLVAEEIRNLADLVEYHLEFRDV